MRYEAAQRSLRSHSQGAPAPTALTAILLDLCTTAESATGPVRPCAGSCLGRGIAARRGSTSTRCARTIAAPAPAAMSLSICRIADTPPDRAESQGWGAAVCQAVWSTLRTAAAACPNTAQVARIRLVPDVTKAHHSHTSWRGRSNCRRISRYRGISKCHGIQL